MACHAESLSAKIRLFDFDTADMRARIPFAQCYYCACSISANPRLQGNGSSISSRPSSHCFLSLGCFAFISCDVTAWRLEE